LRVCAAIGNTPVAFDVVSRVAESPVRELRLAVTVEDYGAALEFYRDVLGLPVVEAWESPTGSGAILDAGRATLELLSSDQAELVDEVEVGRRVAGPIRLALEVEDSVQTARALVAGGAEQLAEPVVTPWSHRNVRVRAPDGMQLTLFTVLGDGSTG
jgi:lactoylglutathione lyase